MESFYKIIRYIILNGAALIGKYNFNYYKKNSKKADIKSEKLLLKIVRKNKNTEYGKKYNFQEIKTIKDYQEKVPYTTYEDYKKYVSQMAENGTQNLITAYKIKYFANTSGTTGEVKRIPIAKKSYNSFFKAGTIFSYQLKKEMRKHKKGKMNGRVLNLSEMVSKPTPSGIREGYVSGYFTSGLKTFLPIATCMPKEVLGNENYIDMKYIKARYALQERDILCINAVFMSALTDVMSYILENKELLINDIKNGSIDDSIKMPEEIRKKLEKKLKPNQKRANELKEVFEKDLRKGIIPALWPRVSLIISICTGEFAPYEKIIREYCDNKVAISYSMYAASEATIATAMEQENKNYILIFDGGFYEFIPTEGEEKPLLLSELEVGKEYEVVVTSLSGMYRYKIKDVIKVVGFEGKAPLMQFAYRKGQLVNVAGIHLTMEHLVAIIEKIVKDLKIDIADYSVYQDTEHSPGRIILFIESNKEVHKSQIEIARFFDEKVIETTPIFRDMLENQNAGESIVHIVKPGTYEKYREIKAKEKSSINQIKTVRLIKDEKTLEYFLNNALDREN